jgi:hypothetical protein
MSTCVAEPVPPPDAAVNVPLANPFLPAVTNCGWTENAKLLALGTLPARPRDAEPSNVIATINASSAKALAYRLTVIPSTPLMSLPHSVRRQA